MLSLKQLDQDLKQLSINDLLVLNQFGEKQQLEKKARNDALWILLANGFAMLIINLLSFDGILTDYLQIGLAIVTIIVGLSATRRGGQSAMFGIAILMSLWSIYYLLVANILQGSINGKSIIIGTLQLALALFYIQKANQYAELDKKTAKIKHVDLYRAIYQSLSQNTPNNSNSLLELDDLTQKIKVWLRPSVIVILLSREHRLFFDTSQSFTMRVQGQDMGGDKLKVEASIIDTMRICSISRHGWLRYTQFTR